jgi:hypothetical protein
MLKAFVSVNLTIHSCFRRISRLQGGFVSEHEAGQRLFQTVHDPRCRKSGVYWSWNGGPREGRGVEAIEKGGQISGGGGAGGGWDSIFENDQSNKVLDIELGLKLFHYSSDITAAEWPSVKQVRSPCPTLNVIGAVTKGMVKREEMKRMREMGRPGMDKDALAPKITLAKKTVLVADKVVSGVAKNTVGRVARLASKKILGDFPEEALTGSFASKQQASEDALLDIEQAVAEQLAMDKGIVMDSEDEALFQQIYDDEASKGRIQEKVPSLKV